jgi:integrase
LLLIGETGARISAALQLKWANVEIDGAGGAIRWPKETNKSRREYLQPLTHGALSALRTAHYWRNKRGSKSEYVFPTGQPSRSKRGYLTKSALLSALTRAESRANIEHKYLRGAHGLRRMIATTIATETGNIVAAMQWIGDEDVRQAKSYLERRASKLEETATIISVLGSSGVFASNLHKLAPKTVRKRHKATS